MLRSKFFVPAFVALATCCLIIAATGYASAATLVYRHVYRREALEGIRLASWMSDLSKYIGDKPLQDIWIPGECSE